MFNNDSSNERIDLPSEKDLPIKQLLATYSNRKAFFEPLAGNHGDKLIQIGSLESFKEAKLNLTNDLSKAEVILINGSGSMTPLWGDGFRVLEKYAKSFANIPLIVLPSSWDIRNVDIALLLKDHKAPIYLYARELYSFVALKRINFSSNVQISLDHDMSFNVLRSSYFKWLLEQKANKHLLIVERRDAESLTYLKEYPLPLWIKLIKFFALPIMHKLPSEIYREFKAVVFGFDRLILGAKRRREAIKSDFVKESVSLIEKTHPQFAKLPIYAADISLLSFCSFKQFNLLIAQAAVVVTTRLHVGILSALLGKPTYIKAGNWHKIRGVYEYSLKDRENVRLI